MRRHSVIHTPKTSDYQKLTEIWESSVRATHDFLPDSYIERLRNLVLTHYLDTVMLICTKDPHQRITGFAGVAAGKVEMLFIDPQHRGQGLGRQLLRYAVEHLNADELEVNEQNPQALGFYLKQGFEVIGRTEHDGLGQPYPLLHMRLRSSGGAGLSDPTKSHSTEMGPGLTAPTQVQ
ncbi:GNAT family N-acetyltransferase [Pseudomonas canadensis]|uniref:GNAT family N-acetyltransferase n=1 Tax=Pseudomonas TaxID=286 RepID=UPI001F01A7CA